MVLLADLTGYRSGRSCRSIREVRSTLQSERSPAVRLIDRWKKKSTVGKKVENQEYRRLHVIAFMAANREPMQTDNRGM